MKYRYESFKARLVAYWCNLWHRSQSFRFHYMGADFMCPKCNLCFTKGRGFWLLPRPTDSEGRDNG